MTSLCPSPPTSQRSHRSAVLVVSSRGSFRRVLRRSRARRASVARVATERRSSGTAAAHDGNASGAGPKRLKAGIALLVAPAPSRSYLSQRWRTSGGRSRPDPIHSVPIRRSASASRLLRFRPRSSASTNCGSPKRTRLVIEAPRFYSVGQRRSNSSTPLHDVARYIIQCWATELELRTPMRRRDAVLLVAQGFRPKFGPGPKSPCSGALAVLLFAWPWQPCMSPAPLASGAPHRAHESHPN